MANILDRLPQNVPGRFYVDSTCIDCGLCVDECPVKAIFPQDDLPAEWNKYIQINLDYYKK